MEGGNAAIHAGLLILRIGVGIVFILHGWPKLSGGTETWSQVGGAMGMVGISFAPAFWGFMAAVAECVGGLLLLLGLFVRPASLLLFITMVVATIFLYQNGKAFSQVSHPLRWRRFFSRSW